MVAGEAAGRAAPSGLAGAAAAMLRAKSSKLTGAALSTSAEINRSITSHPVLSAEKELSAGSSPQTVPTRSIVNGKAVKAHVARYVSATSIHLRNHLWWHRMEQ